MSAGLAALLDDVAALARRPRLRSTTSPPERAGRA